MEKDIKKILINKNEINEEVKKIANDITSYYRGKDLTIIVITTGGVVFFSDLIRNITIPIVVDTISASSYGNSTESNEVTTILSVMKTNLKDREVLIVDDIFDTGKTLEKIIQEISKFKPKEIKTCVLLEKPDRCAVNISPDFVCFKNIPNEFVVGYGLDYNERYRNLPYIAVLKDSIINK